MKSLKNSLLIFLLAVVVSLRGQGNDTVTFTVDEFLALVKSNHPVAAQAALIKDAADAERLKANGNFDPKLYNDTRQKYFDSKTYYRLQNAGLHIPAWFGLSAKAGYQLNDGVFLNDQNTVPDNGLWYADLSLTLGKGLFIDQRRATLKQAALIRQSADFEIELMLNQLFGEALQSYWNWYQSYKITQLYNEATKLAYERFRQVKQNALIGEEPYIDTLEAYIQYQNRLLHYQKSQVSYNKASQQLETYLWLEGRVPLELDSLTFPVEEINIAVGNLADDWLAAHPLLQYYDLKIQRLEVEQRLNREQLKPQVDVSYKFLNEPIPNQEFFYDYSMANYQWGVTASFPIFLRKERGEIRKTEVKLKETNYELELKQRDLQNNVEALLNELNLTARQLTETRQMVQNYQRLLQAEITKFRNGESSLFLINQREIKFLESREKEMELEAGIQRVLAQLKAQAGLLADNTNQ